MKDEGRKVEAGVIIVVEAGESGVRDGEWDGEWDGE